MGGNVSGWNRITITSTAPEKINVVHSTQRHDTAELSAMNPPTTGPNSGPVKAAFAKIGNVNTRSMGFHRSLIDPPAHVSGVDPNSPARKRKTSWAPRLGASADAMIKIMYRPSVTM